jgi:hypothetical protein
MHLREEAVHQGREKRAGRFQRVLKRLCAYRMDIEVEETKISASLFKEMVKGHDSIHALLSLATCMFSPSDENDFQEWRRSTAFLSQDWEAFDLLHSSYYEALHANYVAGSILLRSALELLLKGAFYQCLTAQSYRQNSRLLDADARGRRLKNRLDDMLSRSGAFRSDIGEESYSVYEHMRTTIAKAKYRPATRIMIQQLARWGILRGVESPSRTVSRTYSKLSQDVHTYPWRTDLGRVLALRPKRVFEAKVTMHTEFAEYLRELRNVVDIGMVITMGVLRDRLRRTETRRELRRFVRNSKLKSLAMKYTSSCLRGLRHLE